MRVLQLRAIRTLVIVAVRVAEGSMYICLCNALTDRDVRAQAEDGRSVAMVYRACGCQPQCGKCVPLVREMLRESGELAAAAVAEGAD
jgi:bacterioferritin-associated ferredoxin